MRISLETGSGDYEVSYELPETNVEVWGEDKSHLDAMIDRAVARIKRAYTEIEEEPND